jgi:hypothetical protein
MVSAVHQSYEIYVERRFREGFPAFKQALLDGSRVGQATCRDLTGEINKYKRQAEKPLRPIFYFFLDEFGRELIDAFQQMDQNSDLDVAAQTNMCSKDAAKVVFQDAHLSALDFLDRITVNILFDVGRMLGIMLDEFLPLKN